MIIGITGKARHGKDTVANILAEYLNCEIHHFAYPMKQSAKILFNWTDEHVYGELKDTVDPKWGISPREFLQWIGTDVFQYSIVDHFQSYAGGRNHWVNLLMDKCNDPDKIYLVPDLRFLHEAKAIKKAGGIIIKVERDIETDVPAHASEMDIVKIKEDVKFNNNSSLNALRYAVKEWIDFEGKV